MATHDHREPLPRPTPGAPKPSVKPFMRLARTHAASAAGDGAVAIALAGSLFFSLDYNAARWRVVLYLVLTLAPFSVVAPLIGPAIDRARGGARWIIIGTCAGRVGMALLMISHIDTLWLFPEAFTMLVMNKGYQVAKSAYLPTVVASDDALVASNSKLAVLSALAAVAGGAPATLATKLGGASWAMGVAVIWFATGTYFAIRVPSVRLRALGAPSDQERLELSSAGVRVASSAMGLLRASVGFLTLWIAFELRARNASPFEFGLVLGPLGAGAIVGAAIAPRLRRLVSEEWMLGGALAITATAGTISAILGGLVGAALITGAVALVSASAKLAFDSLVQRDAPNADHGRAFAAYEARFQLVWVVGALCGVLLPFPLRLGFATVAVGAMGTGALFVLGRRAIAAGTAPPKLSEVVLRVMSEPVPARPVVAGAGSAAVIGGTGGWPARDAGAEPTRQMPTVGARPSTAADAEDTAVIEAAGGSQPSPRPAPTDLTERIELVERDKAIERDKPIELVERNERVGHPEPGPDQRPPPRHGLPGLAGLPDLHDVEDLTVIAPPPAHDPRQGRR